jgi:hypothetical protein
MTYDGALATLSTTTILTPSGRPNAQRAVTIALQIDGGQKGFCRNPRRGWKRLDDLLDSERPLEGGRASADRRTRTRRAACPESQDTLASTAYSCRSFMRPPRVTFQQCRHAFQHGQVPRTTCRAGAGGDLPSSST